MQRTPPETLFPSRPPVAGAVVPDRVVRSVCSPNCLGTCGVNVFVKDDQILKIEPASYPDPGFERICLKGIAMAKERIHHPNRVRHPMIRTGERGAGQWREASWAEAYDYIAERMTRIAERDGWKANAWLGMTGNYGARAQTSKDRAANTLGGTLFTNGGLMSDLAGMLGLSTTLGALISSNEVADIVHSKYMLFAGRNTADTGHSEMHFVFDALENGAKLAVIDPRFSRTAAKADEWLPLRPGTDVALVLGMLNVLISERLIKTDYVRDHTNSPFLVREDTGAMLRERDLFPTGGEGYLVWDEAVGKPVLHGDAKAALVRGSWEVAGVDGSRIVCQTAFDALWSVWSGYTPEAAEKICGVPADQIRRVAREYATTDPAWLYVGQGSQRYHGGHNTFRAYATLAAFCGNIGKRYAGLSFLDGPYVRMITNMSEAWTSPTGRPTHYLSGTRMLEAIVDGNPYPIRSLWLDNYGFATQSPLFKRFTSEALPMLDLFVVNEQMMTPAAEFADVVLPVVSYYEDDWELVGGGEIWFMQLRQRAIAPVGTSRNDYEIYKGICERLGKGEHWQLSLEETARMMLQTNKDPSIRAVDWEVLKRDGVARVPRLPATGNLDMPSLGIRPVVPFSTTSDERVPFMGLKFNTPSGRIEVYQEQFHDIGEALLDHIEPLESPVRKGNGEFPLTLITYKIVHSVHSTHLMLKGIRELLPEPILEIHPADAARRRIADGTEVFVYNSRGRFRVRCRVLETVRPGMVAMPQGWWHRDFVEGHHSDLGHIKGSAFQNRVMTESNYPAFDVGVEVRPVEEAPNQTVRN